MLFLIIVLLFVLCAFALNLLYKRTNHFCNQFVDVRKYWKRGGIADNLQIVNVGSNHPKFGFDYSETGIRGENCAIGPQTFEYDFAVLRKITPHLGRKAVVVFPVCLQNFFLYRQSNRGTHLKYYTFLESQDIVGYSWKEKLVKLYFPLLRHPKCLRYLLKDTGKDTRHEWTENPMKTDAELNKDADFWINCWNREFQINIPSLNISDKNHKDIRHNIELMREMIAYCGQHSFQPIIVILPVTTYLSSRFSDDYLNTHVYHYINESAKAGVPVLNYLKDERFTSPEWYINSFFFNKRGRQYFTQVFVNDLKKRGKL